MGLAGKYFQYSCVFSNVYLQIATTINIAVGIHWRNVISESQGGLTFTFVPAIAFEPDFCRIEEVKLSHLIPLCLCLVVLIYCKCKGTLQDRHRDRVWPRQQPSAGRERPLATETRARGREPRAAGSWREDAVSLELLPALPLFIYFLGSRLTGCFWCKQNEAVRATSMGLRGFSLREVLPHASPLHSTCLPSQGNTCCSWGTWWWSYVLLM